MIELNNIPQSKALIQRFGLVESDTRPAIPAAMFMRGFTLGDAPYLPHSCREAVGFLYREDWSDGYRSVWINADEMAIFTYCEGDLDLTIDDCPVTFINRLESADKFYKELL